MADSRLSCKMKMTVPWSDCDAAGISYFPKNFEWFTNSYLQLLELHGFPYMETFHHNGLASVCLKADCEYKRMVKPLEKITVHTSLTSLTRTRLQFKYQVIKENGEIASEGFTNHAFVNKDGKPVDLKKQLPAIWENLYNKYHSSIAMETMGVKNVDR